MRQLTGSTSIHFLRQHGFLSPEVAADNVCHWNGCTCTDGRLTSFVWPDNPQRTYIQVYMRYFPSTLENIEAVRQRLRGLLTIRHLPRDLTHIEMPSCFLRGSLEMDQLPEKLESFQMRYNFFIGTVVLTNLPRQLKVLDIKLNTFREIYLDAANFPPGLKLTVGGTRDGSKTANIHWLSGKEQKGLVFTF